MILIVLFSCASPPAVTERENGATPVPSTDAAASFDAEKKTAVIPPDAGRDYLTIIAAGDNLYHNVMIRDGEDGDYEPAYKEIRALVEKADIAFVNQETPLAGEDFGFSGFPRFNTPQKLGRALSATGFNVVNHATNHIMDQAEKGVLATLDFWDTIPGVTVLGIHRSEKERERPALIRKNNITVGFLSYTYGTNGITVPKDKQYLVSVIDTEIMEKEIDALRPLCDFLVVSMHWGEEYRPDINKEQEKLAAFLAEHLVDLVIGHHPHVLQPIKYLSRPDGKFMLCYYSLGNLVSAQSQNPALLGAMAYLRIKKIQGESGASDSVFIVDSGAIPLVTHYEKNYTNFLVYPLYGYTEELLEKHRKNQDKPANAAALTLEYLHNLSAEILGSEKIRREPFR